MIKCHLSTRKIVPESDSKWQINAPNMYHVSSDGARIKTETRNCFHALWLRLLTQYMIFPQTDLFISQHEK